jgi:WD40 repeat protein
MPCVRRVLGWLLFLGFLWAVGWAVYGYVRHTPRCVIEGPLVVHLSADGSQLATLQFTSAFHIRAPLQVWDTRTGRCIRQSWNDESLWFQESPNGRRAVAWVDMQWLWLIDWDEGTEKRLERHTVVHNWEFSPQGKWLFVDVKTEKNCIFFDGATGVAKQRFEGTFREFAPDERHVLLRGPRDEGPIRVADLETGKVLELPAEAWDAAIAPTGKHLVAWMNSRAATPHGDKDTDSTSWKRGLFVWDLTTFQMKYRLDLDANPTRRLVFSPDDRLVASWLAHPGETDLKVIDLETGSTCEYAPRHVAAGGFSDDNSMFWLEHNGTVTMFDISNGCVLWERSGGSSGFAVAGGFVIQSLKKTPVLEFVDARSGKLLASTPSDFVAEYQSKVLPYVESYFPRWTPDRRHLSVSGSLVRNVPFWEEWLQKLAPKLFRDLPQVTLVMEAATGRELFRLRHSDSQEIRLSDDGGTLVLTEFPGNLDVSCEIRVWDVSPTRAYLWAIGIAAGTAIVLLGLRRAWFKLKASAASTKQRPASSATV